MMTGKKNIGAFTSLYPTPLVLCGTYDAEGRSNLATLAWVGICSNQPPAIQISLRPSRYTYATIVERRAFTVNIPSVNYVGQADFCGMTSGKRVDKFAATRLTPERGQFVDAPLVLEFPVCMECRLLHTFAIGSHDMFVGEIMASWIALDCLEPDGAVNPSKIAPITYAPGDGGYYSIGYPVGRAFDAGRIFMEEKK